MGEMVRGNPIIVLTKIISHACRRGRFSITDRGSLDVFSGAEHVGGAPW